MAVTVKLHKTTQDDSEEHEGSEEMRSAEEKSAEGENKNRETTREGIEESRDEARGGPHNNGEGDTHREPQHKHQGLEDNE